MPLGVGRHLMRPEFGISGNDGHVRVVPEAATLVTTVECTTELRHWISISVLVPDMPLGYIQILGTADLDTRAPREDDVVRVQVALTCRGTDDGGSVGVAYRGDMAVPPRLTRRVQANDELVERVCASIRVPGASGIRDNVLRRVVAESGDGGDILPRRQWFGRMPQVGHAVDVPVNFAEVRGCARDIDGSVVGRVRISVGDNRAPSSFGTETE